VSREQRLRLHHGVVAGGVLTAIALLFIFYSVVNGAVSHASLRRTAMASAAFGLTGTHLPSLRKEHSVVVAGLSD